MNGDSSELNQIRNENEKGKQQIYEEKKCK